MNFGKRLFIGALAFSGCTYVPETRDVGVDLTTPMYEIDYGRNRGVIDAAISGFREEFADELLRVPIYYSSRVGTAGAWTARHAAPGRAEAIMVNTYWDSIWGEVVEAGVVEFVPETYFVEDAFFSNEFKEDLLRHEYWHIFAGRRGLDGADFYKKFREWYLDENSGVPGERGFTYGENRMKYIVAWYLYDSENWEAMQYNGRYAGSERGIEESAYIWEEISDVKNLESSLNRISELSPDLYEHFKPYLPDIFIENAMPLP